MGTQCLPFHFTRSSSTSAGSNEAVSISLRASRGSRKSCVAKCDEVTLLDKLDIDLAKGPIGRVNALKMKEIVKAIRWCIRDDDLK